jgi:hypothetical protein
LIIDNCSYSTKLALTFNADLMPKIAEEIAPSNGAIWDEFTEQR